jgi:hypothetical protein
MPKQSIQWFRIRSATGSSCRGEAVRCVRDDSVDFGAHVRRSTAAQYVATKVKKKYRFNIPARPILACLSGFSDNPCKKEVNLFIFGHFSWGRNFRL